MFSIWNLLFITPLLIIRSPAHSLSFVALRFELDALHLLGGTLQPELHLLFALVAFEQGLTFYPEAGLKLWSFQAPSSQVTGITGLSHQAPLLKKNWGIMYRIGWCMVEFHHGHQVSNKNTGIPTGSIFSFSVISLWDSAWFLSFSDTTISILLPLFHLPIWYCLLLVIF